jgi:hypothetical protein
MAKRKMHEISTDIMKLQMGLDMIDPKERELKIQDLFEELYDKEDGIYWLFNDNERKIDMIIGHIDKCRKIMKSLSKDNDQIKLLVISTNESLDTIPKHSVFNPVSIRESNGSVDIIDSNDIPQEYWIEVVTKKLDKKRILKELKAGKTIPGANLKTKPFVSGLKERKTNENI